MRLYPPQYNDLVASAANVRLPASSAPDQDAWLTDLLMLAFDDGGGEYVHVEGIQVPHGIVVGDDIPWHVHFVNTAEITDGETVVWRFRYTAARPWQTFPALANLDFTFTNNAATRAIIAAVDADAVDGTSIVANTHLMATNSDAVVDGDLVSASSVINGRLERLSSGTASDDVLLLSTDGHMKIEKFGTYDEWSD